MGGRIPAKKKITLKLMYAFFGKNYNTGYNLCRDKKIVSNHKRNMAALLTLLYTILFHSLITE